MKAKFRILLVIIGLMVAIITAGVPIVKEGGKERKPQKAGVCYTENDVRFLMRLNGCSRETAIQLLELSCEFAVTD